MFEKKIFDENVKGLKTCAIAHVTAPLTLQ